MEMGEEVVEGAEEVEKVEEKPDEPIVVTMPSVEDMKPSVMSASTKTPIIDKYICRMEWDNAIVWLRELQSSVRLYLTGERKIANREIAKKRMNRLLYHLENPNSMGEDAKRRVCMDQMEELMDFLERCGVPLIWG